MVSHPKTPILNCFYHLLWSYFVTVSEFSCCNGTDPLLLICDILQCFFKITQIVELLASS